MLRLLEQLKVKGARSLRHELRDAARRLSMFRDRHVVHAQAGALLKVPNIDANTKQAVADLRLMLRGNAAHARERHLIAQARKAVSSLADVATEVRAQNIKRKRLEAALQNTQLACKAALKRSRRTGLPEHFHEWRKRVKELYYQIEALQPLVLLDTEQAAKRLKKTGKVLGEGHDWWSVGQELRYVPKKGRKLILAKTLECNRSAIKLARQLGW